MLGSSPTNHLQTNTTTSNRKPNLDISSSSSTVIREKSNISILETGQGRSHGRRWWQRWRSQAVFTYVSRVQIQIVSEKGSLDACFDTRRGEREGKWERERQHRSINRWNRFNVSLTVSATDIRERRREEKRRERGEEKNKKLWWFVESKKELPFPEKNFIHFKSTWKNMYANEFYVQFNAVSIDRLPSNSCLSFLIFLKKREKKIAGERIIRTRRSTEWDIKIRWDQPVQLIKFRNHASNSRKQSYSIIIVRTVRAPDTIETKFMKTLNNMYCFKCSIKIFSSWTNFFLSPSPICNYSPLPLIMQLKKRVSYQVVRIDIWYDVWIHILLDSIKKDSCCKKD